jgi:hypothetical protein
MSDNYAGTGKPFAWSVSRLDDYEKCPAKLLYKLRRVPVAQPSVSGQQGIDEHKQAEQYVKGELKALPPVLKLFKLDVQHIKVHHDPEAEAEVAFTRNFKSLTGWFSKDTWFRGKLDLRFKSVDEKERPVINVVDYKTGKVKPFKDLADQSRVYAMVSLHAHPEAHAARVQFWFTKFGVRVPEAAPTVYVRKTMLEGTTREYILRAKRMEQEKKFAPRPSAEACRFCDYSKHKGGPCQKSKYG